MIEYGKVITIESVHDSKIIDTRHEYEQSILTDREALMKDVIDSMDVITNNLTNKLCLEVKVNDKGKIRIIKRWQV